ncbi:MAG TPA: FHA domain-containing protein, partial [Actinotalea sp.]|nr:FHA domain-containing protein [Actinotalea sp.]
PEPVEVEVPEPQAPAPQPPAPQPPAPQAPGPAEAAQAGSDSPDAPPAGSDQPVAPRVASEDHDGLTVLSSDVVALRRQLPAWTGNAVPALAVPTPRTPPPAKLLMSSGLTVALNRPVLIGRAPQVTRVASDEIPRLLTVASPNQDISRTHAEVRMDGEDVIVTDLHSTNGVLLLRQGSGPQRLHPGEPTVVEHGVVVDLGEGVTFIVEAGG